MKALMDFYKRKNHHKSNNLKGHCKWGFKDIGLELMNSNYQKQLSNKKTMLPVVNALTHLYSEMK